LLDFVAALLQDCDHAAGAGKVTRSRHDCGGLARFHFSLDAIDPPTLATIEHPLGRPPHARDSGGERTDIAAHPGGTCFGEKSCDSLVPGEGIDEQALAIALQHFAPERDVFVDSFQARDFLPRAPGLRNNSHLHAERTARAERTLLGQEPKRDRPRPVMPYLIEL